VQGVPFQIWILSRNWGGEHDAAGGGRFGEYGEILKYAPEFEDVRLTQLRIVKQAAASWIGEV